MEIRKKNHGFELTTHFCIKSGLTLNLDDLKRTVDSFSQILIVK